MSGIVSMLAKTHIDKVADPDMAKMFAAICKELAKQHRYLMENDSSRKIKEKDAATIAG